MPAKACLEMSQWEQNSHTPIDFFSIQCGRLARRQSFAIKLKHIGGAWEICIDAYYQIRRIDHPE